MHVVPAGHVPPQVMDGAQTPVGRQRLEAHSAFTVHAVPSAQPQPPGQPVVQVDAPHWPLVQTLEAQSDTAPHAAPTPQAGLQAGGAHFPFALHTPEAQSVDAPHPAPSWQPGLHVGGAHCPFAPHTPEAQSVGAPHAAPARHAGLQAGGAHLPLAVQTPEAQSVDAPHPAPS